MDIATAVKALVEQVPEADGFQTKLIKEKFELLKEMTPPVRAVYGDEASYGLQVS